MALGWSLWPAAPLALLLAAYREASTPVSPTKNSLSPEERRLAIILAEREGDMRTQVFFLTFALLAVLSQSTNNRHHLHHHSHVESKGQGGGGGGGGGGELASRAKAAARAWPCCDSCGGCTKSNPPRCQCLDAVPRGCHPACRDCVKSSLSADPPVYQCMDRVPNFCQRRCTAAAAH